MSTQTKNRILMVVALLPFIIGGLLLYRAAKPSKRQVYPESTNTKQSGSQEILTIGEKGEVVPLPGGHSLVEQIISEPGALPYNFPAGLITEKNLTFRQSFREDHVDEHYTLAFVEYESRNSAEKNVSYFSDYLKNGLWETLRERNEEGVFEISAVRGDDGIVISVGEIHIGNAEGGEKTYIITQVSYYKDGADALKKLVKNP